MKLYCGSGDIASRVLVLVFNLSNGFGFMAWYLVKHRDTFTFYFFRNPYHFLV